MLLVVCFHSRLPLPGGFTGVDVFFVISGFVIGGMLIAELDSSGRIRLRSFYVRRARRLLPGLAVVLVFATIAGIYLTPVETQGIEGRTAIYASVFAANFYLYRVPVGYFDPAATTNPLLHTWTLAVEEQFYLVFPAILLVSWWAGRRFTSGRTRATSSLVIGVIASISFVGCLGLARGSALLGLRSPQSFAFYSSPTRAWEFAVGALLALAAPALARLRASLASAVGVLGASLLTLAAAVVHQTGFPGPQALLPVAGAAAIIASGIATAGPVSRLLQARSLTWIGDRSYSWYLWHWPLIVFATSEWPRHGWIPAVAALGSLLPAAASYRFVENPVRFSSRVTLRPLVAIAAACVVVPIASAYALDREHERLVGSAPLAEWARSQQMHADAIRGCDSGVPLQQRARRVLSACTWHVAAAKGTVMLMGDSNAGHFTEAVTRAANRDGYDALVVTSSGCPFIGVAVYGTFMDPAECTRFESATLSAVIRRRPSLVLLAARTDGIIETPQVGIRDPTTNRLVHSARRKAALWRVGLDEVLGSLHRAGVPVIVVHPVPAIPSLPTSCTATSILAGRCSGETSRSAADARLRRSVDAEDAAVAAVPDTWTLDVENEICSPTTCASNRGGVRLYRNSDHLSVEGALELTSDFARAIAAHARPRPTH